jgi:hypothetical protein
MFGDPKQHDHMMAGVKGAYASPNTPVHLRPHLAKRLGGNMAFPPKKTVVGPTGHSPIKTVATTPRFGTTPRKDIVGSTARPLRKDVVGNLAAPRPKTIVGSTAAPPLKTTPANLGTGGKRPLGIAAADRGPINAGNPSTRSRSLGRGDGNLGRSVAPMPPPASGPPNPVLTYNKPLGLDAIQYGGMGATPKRMGRAPVPKRGRSVRPSQFFGE